MKWKATQQEWTKVDQSEVIYDNLDPNYSHHFNVIYNMGQIVQLKFEIDDIDNNTKQSIGEAEINLAKLVMS
jgi:hypothetical protein